MTHQRLISKAGLDDDGHTRTVESLAARARMSAQDTVSGHSTSNADLISSITSNPLAEFRFGLDRFSLRKAPVLSRRRDASQPYKSFVALEILKKLALVT